MPAHKRSSAKKSQTKRAPAGEARARSKLLNKMTNSKKEPAESAMTDVQRMKKLKSLDAQIHKLQVMRARFAITTPNPLDILKTQEIATLLNVSRPHVTKLMDDGLLKHHRVGTHRRALRKDVDAFKAQMYGSMDDVFASVEKDRALGFLAAKVISQKVSYEPSGKHPGFFIKRDNMGHTELGQLIDGQFVAAKPHNNDAE